MFTSVLENKPVFVSQNPHLVSEYVNQHIGRHNIAVRGRTEESASLWHTDISDIALSRISYGNDVRVRSPDLEEIYHIQVVLKGKCQWAFKESHVNLEAGQCILLNPHDRVDLRYSEDCEKIIIKIPKKTLYAGLGNQIASIPSDGIQFDHQVSSLSDHVLLIQLMNLIFLEAETDQVENPIFAQYGNILATKLFDSFSNNAEVVDESQQYHRCFSLIDSYIRNNIKAEVTVDDLANLSKVSARTLYNLFSRYKSITPMHYIKQQKLLQVRKVLSGQEGPIRNVTEVALDYGFMHLGRFSNEYKKLFGELPSQTIKKN